MTQNQRSGRTPQVVSCGRRSVLDFVVNAMDLSGTRLVVLAGARLDGKTSLLRWLARSFPDRYVAVYVNPVTWPPLLPNEVMPFVAHAIAQSLHIQGADGRQFSDDYFREADELLAGRRLALLLDELPVESRSDGGGSSQVLLTELHDMMRRWPALYTVLGLGRRLHEVDVALLDSLADARVRYLSPVLKDEIVLMAEESGVQLTPDGLQRVDELAGGQPALVSWLCSCLAEYVHWLGKTTLNGSDIEQVLERAMVGEDVQLVKMWQSLDFAERVLLIVLAHHESGQAGEATLHRALAERGLRLAGFDLPAALDRLIDIGLLQRHSPSEDLMLAQEAFRRWVKQRFPLGNLREALEKMNPRAAEEYMAARDFQSRGKSEEAAATYGQVLEMNPNHCLAWLGLGQTLVERGDTSRAVEAFDRAYELDRALSVDSLTAGLLEQARLALSEGQEGQAIRAYRRVLQIAPGHGPARENLLSILSSRAESFVQRGDLERARQSYGEMLEVEPGDESITARLAELRERRASGHRGAAPGPWRGKNWRAAAGLGAALCLVAVALFTVWRGGFQPGSKDASAALAVTVQATSQTTAVTSTPVAAAVIAIPSSTRELAPTPSATAAEVQAADTPVQVEPSPTATDTRAPTRVATASPTFTPAHTPSPARRAATDAPVPTQTATPTATSSVTSTPTPAIAMPTLLDPPTGAYFSGAQTRFELRWLPVGPLALDEWYGLSVRYMHNGQLVETGSWLKETYWVAPEYLAGQADEPERRYQWDVVVVKELPPRPDGTRVGREISRRSETRTFVWR